MYNNNKIVIKANDSCKGKDVYFCSDEEQVEQIVKKLFLNIILMD